MPRVGGKKNGAGEEGGEKRNGTVKAAVLISRDERGIANESRLKERAGIRANFPCL